MRESKAKGKHQEVWADFIFYSIVMVITVKGLKDLKMS